MYKHCKFSGQVTETVEPEENSLTCVHVKREI